jgi:UDP-glucose 4-epimerase
MSKTIVVTGGSGFIGSHLCQHLDSSGHKVISIDTCVSDSVNYTPEDVRHISIDCLNKKDVSSVLESICPDSIYHLSAISNVNESSAFIKNVDMTRNIIESIVQSIPDGDRPNFYLASSSTVYGTRDTQVSTSSKLLPESMYGASKVSSESLAAVYENQNDVDVTMFRLANVVGPRLRNAVVPDFIEKLLTDSSTLEILGNGEQKKSYVHVTDCVQIMTFLAQEDIENTLVNVSTIDTITVNLIASIVESELSVSPSRLYTGGKKGWKGDVHKIQPEPEVLQEFNCLPMRGSEEAVRHATQELIPEIKQEL